VRRVYIGGGMARGKAGEIMTAQAQATLQGLAHSTACEVE
jgi:hypothetical protein